MEKDEISAALVRQVLEEFRAYLAARSNGPSDATPLAVSPYEMAGSLLGPEADETPWLGPESKHRLMRLIEDLWHHQGSFDNVLRALFLGYVLASIKQQPKFQKLRHDLERYSAWMQAGDEGYSGAGKSDARLARSADIVLERFGRNDSPKTIERAVSRLTIHLTPDKQI